jgi:hypothetical protein
MAADARTRSAGGGLTGETRCRVPGHGLARGLHQEVVRETAKPSRVMRSTRTRRRHHTARRSGGVRRRYSGERLRATQGAGSSSSDTGELLTCLCNSETTPRRQRGGDGRGTTAVAALGFRRQRECTGRCLGFLVLRLWGGGALNRSGNRKEGGRAAAGSDSGLSPAWRRRARRG